MGYWKRCDWRKGNGSNREIEASHRLNSLARTAALRRSYEFFPGGGKWIEQRGAKHDALHFSAGHFNPLLRIKHVAGAQQLQSSHSDQNRQGARESHASRTVWQYVRVF